LIPGAQIFLACSDTSRLRILHLIMTNGEMCITDWNGFLIHANEDFSPPDLFKKPGILTSRKFNQWMFYQIKDEVFDINTTDYAVSQTRSGLAKRSTDFQTMYTNRELTLNRLKNKPLGHV